MATRAPQGFKQFSTGVGGVLMEEGSVLSGHFIGPGPVKTMQRGRKKQKINTWIIADKDGTEHTLFASWQLDAFCKQLKKGDEVWIERTGKVKTASGQQVNTYRMFYKSKGRGSKA